MFKIYVKINKENMEKRRKIQNKMLSMKKTFVFIYEKY